MVVLFMLFSTSWMVASEDGIFGQFQAGCGGGACHGGAKDNATTLTLNGPATVRTGETHDYTFVVAHRDLDAAGMNVAFRTGAGGAAGDITPGNNQRGGVDQVTHDGPLQFVNRAAQFNFEWETPAAHGIYTFNGAGNAVDDNGQRTNDVWNTMTKQITVKGLTLTGPLNNESFCQTGVLNVTWTQTGISTVRIELSDDNFVTFDNIGNTVDATVNEFNYTIPLNQEAGTTYRIRVIDLDGSVELARSGIFVISGGPTITTQPADQEICEGQTLTVSIAAVGNAITYQWRKNDVNIPNANAAILRITNVAPAQSGTYDCVVTACEVEVASEPAEILVLGQVKVTEQPQNVSVCLGDRASLSTSASGHGIAYQWLKNGSPISGETTRTLTISAVDVADEGRYACRITGTCAPQRVTDTVTLNVMELPAITLQPVSISTYAVGSRLELIVEATGDGLEYQWLKDGEELANEIEASLVVESVTFDDDAIYAVVVYNACDTVVSTNADVGVIEEESPGRLILNRDTLDLGKVTLCTVVTDGITDGLGNAGTKQLVVSAPTLEPPGTFEVTAPSFPITLAGGQMTRLWVAIPVDTLGPFVRKVIFQDGDSTITFYVVGEGVSALVAEPDTLVFASGTSGEVKCATTLPFDCPEIVISSITIGGQGASSYEMQSPTELPVTIANGEELAICVRSIDTSSRAAVLTIVSNQGSVDIPVVRRGATSVDEDRYGIRQLVVVPNPMKDEVSIESPLELPIEANVYSVLGAQLAQLSGDGTIRWDGRDASGRLLSSGVYVLHITQGGFTSVVKLVIER